MRCLPSCFLTEKKSRLRLKYMEKTPSIHETMKDAYVFTIILQNIIIGFLQYCDYIIQ